MLRTAGGLGSSWGTTLYQKPWLCRATLSHLDLRSMALRDTGETLWFFGQLQTPDRLTTLVLPIHQIRRALTILSPRSDREDVNGLFYFPSVTHLQILFNHYSRWSKSGQVTFEEAAFMIESAPSLISLLLAITPERDCCSRLVATYPRLRISLLDATDIEVLQNWGF